MKTIRGVVQALRNFLRDTAHIRPHLAQQGELVIHREREKNLY
jgi:hypothetical protein